MQKKSPHFVRTRTMLLASLIAAGGLAGCGKTNLSDIEHIARAKDFQDKGDLTATVIELKGALKKNPDNAEARWLLGQIYVDLESGAAAEKELMRARELGVDPNSVLVPLGRALLQQNKAKQVLDEIQISNNAPAATRIGVLTVRGEAHLALQQKEAAQTDLSAALEACGNSKCIDTLLALSHLEFSKNNDAVKAREWLMKAITQDPKSGKAWLHMGDLEQALNHPQAALNAYTKSVQANARDLRALAERSHIYLQLAKNDASKADLETLKKLSPQYPAIQYLEGRHALLRKEAAQAQAFLEAFLKGNPTHASAIYYLAIAHAVQEHLQQANDLLVRLVSTYPNSSQARNLLANVQLRRGALDEAIKTLEPMAAQIPSDIVSLKLLGRLFLRKGDLQTAVNYLQQAAVAEPSSTTARLELGQALQAQGKTDLALAQFDAALEIQPDLIEAELSRILLHLRDQKYDIALQDITRFKTRHPKNPVPDTLAAGAHLGKKDYVKARQSFEQALALDPKHIPARSGLAQLALLQNDLITARRHYQDVLKQDPNHLDTLLTLAGLATRIGKPKDAIIWLEKARQAHPKAIAPAVLLVNAYLQKEEKDPLKALALASEIYSAYPNHSDVQQTLGKAQLAAGETSSALATFRKLTEQLPASPQAQYLLAQAQMKSKDTKGATISLNKVLKLNPHFLPASVALAEFKLQDNHPQEALRIVRQIQKQQEKSPVGYELEGNIHIRSRAYTQAVKAYTTAYQLNRNGEMAIKLATAHNQAGNTKEAYNILTQWLAQHPDDTNVRVVLANAYQQDSKAKEAIEQYHKALETQPKNVVALNNLGAIYHELQDPRALGYAEKAYKLAEDQPAIMDTLGWILINQGQVKRGMEIMQEAATKAPTSPQIRYHLSFALDKVGRGQEARKDLEALLAKEKKFPEFQQAKELLTRLQSAQ